MVFDAAVAVDATAAAAAVIDCMGDQSRMMRAAAP